MIQEIIEAIKEKLKAEPRLNEIKTHHIVDGMLPALGPTISIGCEKIKYADKDSDLDEVTANIRVYVYTKDMAAERGEQKIKYLAKEIRYTLLEDIYLGGLVGSSTVTDITHMSDQVNNGSLIHFAMVDYEVTYFESRRRPDNDPLPTVKVIGGTLNSQQIDIDL
ncbi:hypothetical protein [Paenibacillus alba]|uniref:Phage tail protein n=1 Tax=Paenibacillus alba TaxID=1197127 RepID=A0ABU6GAS2_9BACL|nr:hypothetical protein [Paenibacillus alba]MEC0231289.1 hypothetical protein [Paenibacillus alba]